MKYRRMGRTGLLVSEIGFGSHHFDRKGNRIGLLTEDSFTEKERIEHMARALDAGINYLHCAHTIGPVRNMEIVLFGRALKVLGRRHDCCLAAQFMSELPEHWNLSDGELMNRVRAQVEEHLRDLHTEVIDILEINFSHYEADFADRSGALMVERTVECLRRLQEEGKLHFIGGVCHEVEILLELLRGYDFFDTIGTPYNVLVPQAREELFPLAKEKDVGTEGIQPFRKGEVLRLDAEDARLRPFRSSPTDSIATLALRWVLSDENLSVTIPGMKSLAEIEENAAVSGS